MAFRPQKHTQVVPLTIQFEGDDSLVVYYRPFALTFGEAKAMVGSDIDGKSDAEKLDVMIDYLLKYVERADWEDNDGNPLPFNRDALESLPIYIVQKVFSAVMDAVNGGGDKSQA
jgi:hypothetical protein